MTLATTTVVGPILLASGEAPPSGYLRFVLDGFDTDSGQIIAPAAIKVDIGAGGAFSADLWPNERGIWSTHYSVFLGVQNGTGQPTDTINLGLISVPESDVDIELEDLLALPTLTGFTATVVLTQAEYDALVTAGTVDPDTLYLIGE